MPKTVLVPIADGTEELEAVTVIDVLRRAGAKVVVASVDNLQITGAQGTVLVADCLISACSDKAFDLIVLPGGMPGSERLRDSVRLIRILKTHCEANKPYGAICAAPVIVLQPHGLLYKRKATRHPGFTDHLNDASAVEQRVVIDGNCVTSRGAGTALAFALELVELLFDAQTRESVAVSLVAV